MFLISLLYTEGAAHIKQVYMKDIQKHSVMISS